MADSNWVEVTKWFVETGSFAVAIFTAWAGFEKAHTDRKEALEQSKRDLRWRQTVEAQSAIRRMYSDEFAQNAMTLLDWNGSSFQIQPDLRESIGWGEMRDALRIANLEFKPKEVFVRNCFDGLFHNFQLIEQQIKNKMFRIDEVTYPIAYYSSKIMNEANWPAFNAFLTEYEYFKAKELIETTCSFCPNQSGDA